MKVLIISDLHNNLRHLDLVALDIKDKNIELVIFCGDFDAPFSLRGFLQFNCPIKAVLGNADPDITKYWWIKDSVKVLIGLDIEISPRMMDLKLEDKRIAIFHNDDEYLTKSLIEGELYDLLCIGQTHEPKIEKNGKTLVVNPGSLVGWKYEKGGKVDITYAIYDTNNNSAVLYSIK
jgi:putative phosphoesterase